MNRKLLIMNMNRIATSLFLCLTMGLSATAQTKAMYDFVVPKDGTFREAIAAANNRKDKDARFRIFVLQGEYEIPTEGKTVGGAQVSPKHAGFIVNIGGATFEDVKNLVELIQSTVKKETGYELKREIIFLN